MSRNSRVGLIGLTVVVLVVAFVIADSGGGSSSQKYSGAATVTVVNAQAKDGIQPLTYKKGQTIDITIKSDTADEIHVHGYDLKKDVPKNGSVHFSFPATIDGVFVIELENHKQQIASLKVLP
jgi:hypothetical protein